MFLSPTGLKREWESLGAGDAQGLRWQVTFDIGPLFFYTYVVRRLSMPPVSYFNGRRSGTPMSHRILVVDDDESVRDLFQTAFSDAGYEVVLAEGGEDALEILQKQDVNVIFLDLKLFGMNGIELCRQIRKFKPVSLIYAMTGWSALYEIEECREAGFDDFFTKPMSLEIIFKAVNDAFEKLDRWRVRGTLI